MKAVDTEGFLTSSVPIKEAVKLLLSGFVHKFDISFMFRVSN
jgi:hypothetical protein